MVGDVSNNILIKTLSDKRHMYFTSLSGLNNNGLFNSTQSKIYIWSTHTKHKILKVKNVLYKLPEKYRFRDVRNNLRTTLLFDILYYEETTNIVFMSGDTIGVSALVSTPENLLSEILFSKILIGEFGFKDLRVDESKIMSGTFMLSTANFKKFKSYSNYGHLYFIV